MLIKRIYILFIIILVSCSSKTDNSKIKFGTLRVIQALPIFVANDLGLYQKHNVDIEIIKFSSALESEIALTANQLDGYFADIITPIILTANGTDLKIITTLFQTDSNQRMFALLAPPTNQVIDTKSIAKAGIAVSSSTVIDYLTPYLLNSADDDVFEYHKVDIKKIPIRLQLLLQNQVAGAVLPEPMATFAEQSGAIILADDRNLGMAPTVAAFRSNFLEQNPKNVRRFLSAISEAIDIINRSPDSVRDIMLNNCQVPNSIRDSYPAPQFPQPIVPSKENMLDAQAWLLNTGTIEKAINIEELLTDEYLP